MGKFESELFVIQKGNAEIYKKLMGFVKYWAKQTAIEVTVQPYYRNRTSLQNRFLHGWIFRKQIMKKLTDSGQFVRMPDGSEVEYDVDVLKEIFKADCIIEKVIEIKRFIGPDGAECKIEPHPSGFKAHEFAKYCELVMDYAQLWYGIEVEPPVSGYWLALYKEMTR